MVRFLPEDAVTDMHDYLIQQYGGEPGLRDAALLDSALNQAKLVVQFSDILPSLHLLAMVFISLKIRHFLTAINVLPVLL